MTTTQLYDKWIELLPTYNRCTGQLRRSDLGAFCCLGVACDISELGQWENNFYKANSDHTEETSKGDNNQVAMLPRNIRIALDLADNYGKFHILDISPELRIEVLGALRTESSILAEDLVGGFTSLANINDFTSDEDGFNLITKILIERPKSLFRKDEPENFYTYTESTLRYTDNSPKEQALQTRI